MTEKIRLRSAASRRPREISRRPSPSSMQLPRIRKARWEGGWLRAGEALIQNQQFPEAIKRLTIFRDHQPWQNVPGLTDEALLRSGYAYSLIKSWDESRVAYERVVNAFPSSRWSDEARYRMAGPSSSRRISTGQPMPTARSSRVRDRACCQGAIPDRTVPHGAEALPGCGECIPGHHDHLRLPGIGAASLLEAGKAYLELNQQKQARRQLEQLFTRFSEHTLGRGSQGKIGPDQIRRKSFLCHGTSHSRQFCHRSYRWQGLNGEPRKTAAEQAPDSRHERGIRCDNIPDLHWRWRAFCP